MRSFNCRPTVATTARAQSSSGSTSQPRSSVSSTTPSTGGTLRIEVSDTRGDRWPAPQEPDAVAESGRGLLLVEAFADRWGVTAGRFPLKTVWAELRLGSPDPGSLDPGSPEPGTPCSGAAGG
ncbi:hypothetical protein A8713_20565 [Streptomyces sp. SAT1]|nr:hypothetical protein A8713_20565 [Streptomyces sp. SAT1]